MHLAHVCKCSFSFLFLFYSKRLMNYSYYLLINFNDKTTKQEGSCIISGLNYDHKSKSFDSCRNVNVIEFESATNFNGLIRSFNISTNQWAGKYIFKRLKFLNSRFVSHICTLIYLAMWHGWRSGYYVTFTLEFLIMKMEWEVCIYGPCVNA